MAAFKVVERAMLIEQRGGIHPLGWFKVVLSWPTLNKREVFMEPMMPTDSHGEPMDYSCTALHRVDKYQMQGWADGIRATAGKLDVAD